MVRKITIILILVCVTWVAHADKLTQVKSKVVNYYNNLKTISLNPSSPQAVALGDQGELDHYFFDNNRLGLSQSLPWVNDFKWLGVWNRNSNLMFPYTYFNTFRELCEESVIKKFDYELVTCKYNAPIGDLKEDKEPKFATVIVKKVFIIAAKGSRVMHDTLSVDLGRMAFSTVCNEAKPSNDLSDLTIGQLLARANLLYDTRRYEEAGQLYELIMRKQLTVDFSSAKKFVYINGQKVELKHDLGLITSGTIEELCVRGAKYGIEFIEKDSPIQDACYNLAIMYQKGQYGKKKYSKKERREKAALFFKQSAKGRRALRYYSADYEDNLRTSILYSNEDNIEINIEINSN